MSRLRLVVFAMILTSSASSLASVIVAAAGMWALAMYLVFAALLAIVVAVVCDHEWEVRNDERRR